VCLSSIRFVSTS